MDWQGALYHLRPLIQLLRLQLQADYGLRIPENLRFLYLLAREQAVYLCLPSVVLYYLLLLLLLLQPLPVASFLRRTVAIALLLYPLEQHVQLRL